MKNMTLAHITEVCGGIYFGSEEKKTAEVTDIVPDSRKAGAGSLFVAIPGERVDGHKFIPNVASQGALAVISEQKLETPPCPYILVKDSMEAIKAMAEYYMQQLRIPVVGITGGGVRGRRRAGGAGAAGREVLFKEYGCTPCNIDVLTFAGGFGNYIDKASAAAIGLFPQELLDKAKEVGNAAGNGAVSAALSQEAWKRALEISKDMRYIELASYPHFDEMYVEHMNF